jgi:anti-sigma regulatory factor (Ser/Thr protein kinase)
MTSTAPRTPRTLVPIDSAPLLAETFNDGRVTELRHAVAARAKAAGLAGQRLDDFVLVVNELITNAVRHGGGRGRLRLWRAPESVLCEISDHGIGISPDRLDDRRRPTPDTAGGWGLWLARRLSDDMAVQTGPTGTTVRITAGLAGGGPTGDESAGPAGGQAVAPAEGQAAGPARG